MEFGKIICSKGTDKPADSISPGWVFVYWAQWTEQSNKDSFCY